MLVRIVRDWPYPANFFRQLPSKSTSWNGIHFTEEKVSECDYLIVLQRPPYRIQVNCRASNAWLITQEPPVDFFRFHQKSFSHFDKVFTYYKDFEHPRLQSMQPVIPWHVNKSYNELTSIDQNNLEDKHDELTWITSNKNGFPGQKARMKLKKYLEEEKFSFNIFGNGFNPIDDKFEGLFPYKYSLAIENYSCYDYWTEKLADSFLSWCLPLYWGAPNIIDFFPEDSLIKIDVNRPKQALQIIRQAIEDNEWERRLEAISEARNLVLNKYQFFPYIADMIKKDIASRPPTEKRKYSIPANPFPRLRRVIMQTGYYSQRLRKMIQV